ncbi:MAG: right-handed parallel beta-helix repeat-containing protein [bacterium]
MLKAIGTAEDSIVFTADDTVLTDTTGGWGGIKLDFFHLDCIIEYCNFEFSYGNAIENWYGRLVLSNCLFRRCNTGLMWMNSSPDSTDTTLFIAHSCVFSDIDNEGIWLYTGSLRAIIVNSNFYNCYDGMYAGGSVSIENCHFYDNRNYGLLLDHVGYQITNCVVENNANDGIYLGGLGGFVRNNEIKNNGGYGAYFTGCMCSYYTLIENNRIWDNTEGGVYLEGHYKPKFQNNIIFGGIEYYANGWWWQYLDFVNNTVDSLIIWPPDTSFIEIETYLTVFNNAFFGSGLLCDSSNVYVYLISENNRICSNSDFVDPGSFNFHLAVGSPCIDAGLDTVTFDRLDYWDSVTVHPETTAAPGSDIEGNPRPYAGGWDIGAYESPYYDIRESDIEKPKALSLSAYPNPFNSAVTITLEGVGAIHELPMQIEIYDVAGRRVDVISQLVTELVEVPVEEGLLTERKSHGRPSRSSQNTKAGGSETAPLRNGVYVWAPDESLGSGIYLVRASCGEHQLAAKPVVYIK